MATSKIDRTDDDEAAYMLFAQQIRDTVETADDIIAHGAVIRSDFYGLVRELRSALDRLGAK